jgi:hypothetical protein
VVGTSSVPHFGGTGPSAFKEPGSPRRFGAGLFLRSPQATARRRSPVTLALVQEGARYMPSTSPTGKSQRVVT